MTEPVRPRSPARAATVVPAPTPPPAAAAPPPKERAREARPFLLDFLPLQGEKETRLARFFARLAEGRLSTTRCPTDGSLLWPPRTACPHCHAETLDWVDLPERGRIYAFSAVLAGAPLGMEADVPFSVGLIDLDGAPLRLFGRIDGVPWDALRIGQEVRVEPYSAPDGRWFYRFRAGP